MGNLLLFVGGIITETFGGNVTEIISVLRFPAGKGTGADTEISGTLNLTEFGVFHTVLNGIQLKLFAVLFLSGHNEYLLW